MSEEIAVVGQVVEQLTVRRNPRTGRVEIAGHILSPESGRNMLMEAAQLFQMKVDHDAAQPSSIVIPHEVFVVPSGQPV